jgi:protein-L-isoaspartate(D-aspartate) O-methyltransferase
MAMNKYFFLISLILGCFVSLNPSIGMTADRFESRRQKLVEDIVRPAGVTDERVLAAIRNTQRHEFVPQKYWEQAYFDRSLPIGDAQTISSPFIVAYMTQLLETKPTDVVLEIGTGSGYQAAVLSPLVKHVYSIEIVEALGKRAEKTLNRLKYTNVSVRVGDGYLGWPEAAPFDKIIVTCSPESVPQPLVDQLKEGGRLVIPVGERYQQMLYVLEKREGKLEQIYMRPTLFVPMTGNAEEARKILPDGSKPELINGDFEADNDVDFIPGWYYGRLVTLESDNTAAKGERYVRFQNSIPGNPAHLMQGFAIDGRKLSRVRLAAFGRTKNMRPGLSADELPVVSLAFYDTERREIGIHWLGPFRNEESWRRDERVFVVPPATREAILRIGLFGATGQADFDGITIEPVAGP